MNTVFVFLYFCILESGWHHDIIVPTVKTVGIFYFSIEVKTMTKVKICGIRSINAAKTAEENGANFIGFIFWRGSHRFIEPETARAISRDTRGCEKVGVFVDEDAELVNEIAEHVGLDYVQLHGHEPPSYAAKIKRPVIKAYRFGDDFDPEAANEYPAELILIDTFKKGQVGGTGERFDWRGAAKETGKLQKPFLTAGGISKENVKEAIDIFHPMGIDVSGSLEVNREKSTRLIEEFLDYFNEIR